MAFKGLFIGIDKYRSADIRDLSCARNDATALHALFTDNLRGETKLILDEQATQETIIRSFEGLGECENEDVVVIAFSGHGTPTHELVTYDADKANLNGTAIPLRQLTSLFAKIPATRLICILDCCFSGGMGAKVLQLDVVPKDIDSTDSLLGQISGKGRIIITASGPTEPAWERISLGHGLLTYYLIAALLGHEEVEQAGGVNVYRLLQFLTQRVIEESTRLEKPQNPTLRGTIDGDFNWPLFEPGQLYTQAFPERMHPKVSNEVESLKQWGFPSGLIQTWARNIPALNNLQVQAINDFDILAGGDLVVSSPTSSGKTMIGELAALKCVLDRKRAVFLLPLKALVNDKIREFEGKYSDFGIRTIEATGETDDIRPLVRGKYDICLLTYEKFSSVLLRYPHIIDEVGAIIIDEAQMIADTTRGANLEFLLTLICMKRTSVSRPQLILLSAVIGESNGFERWLDARLLRSRERPVPLDEGLLLPDGRFRYMNSESGQEHITEPLIRPERADTPHRGMMIPLVQKLIKEGKQVIVFRDTKSEARSTASYLSKALELPPANEVIGLLPAGDPSGASDDLRMVVSKGVAFHTAALEREERLVSCQLNING